MQWRSWLSVCVCAYSLAACGHPIRDLADEVKGFIPDDAAKLQSMCPAQATSRIALVANLHAGDAIAAWDAAKPEASASFVVSGSPYASDGHSVDMRIFFVHVAADVWEWHVLANRGAGELGGGELHFGADGALVRVDVTVPLRIPLVDGSLSAPIALDVGTPSGDASDGFDGVTATGQPSALESYEQDGRGWRVGGCT